jgi:hypothetical protein
MEILSLLWSPPLHGTTVDSRYRSPSPETRTRAPTPVVVEEIRRHASRALPGGTSGNGGEREAPKGGEEGRRWGPPGAAPSRRYGRVRVDLLRIEFDLNVNLVLKKKLNAYKCEQHNEFVFRVAFALTRLEYNFEISKPRHMLKTSNVARVTCSPDLFFLFQASKFLISKF